MLHVPYLLLGSSSPSLLSSGLSNCYLSHILTATKHPARACSGNGEITFFFSFHQSFCQRAKGVSKDTVLLHVLFQAEHLTGQMESAVTLLPRHCGSRSEEHLSFESFGGFSPWPKAQLVPLCPCHSNHLDSLSVLGQKTCSVLFFLCLSMAKARGRQRNLPPPKGGKKPAVLKTIRKTKARTLSQYQLARWQ